MNLPSIESRLAALEKGVRVWKSATITLSLMLVAIVGVAAEKDAGAVQDVVRAKRIEVVNGEGKVATLDADDLTFFGEDHKALARMGRLNKSGSMMIADNSLGGPRWTLLTGERLAMFNRKDKKAVEIESDDIVFENPSITLLRDGEFSGQVIINNGKWAGIRVTNKEGHAVSEWP